MRHDRSYCIAHRPPFHRSPPVYFVGPLCRVRNVGAGIFQCSHYMPSISCSWPCQTADAWPSCVDECLLSLPAPSLRWCETSLAMVCRKLTPGKTSETLVTLCAIVVHLMAQSCRGCLFQGCQGMPWTLPIHCLCYGTCFLIVLLGEGCYCIGIGVNHPVRLDHGA